MIDLTQRRKDAKKGFGIKSQEYPLLCDFTAWREMMIA